MARSAAAAVRCGLPMEQNVGYVDLIAIPRGSAWGGVGPSSVDFFARNAQGLHVPITTMSYEDQRAARAAKVRRGW